MRTGKRILVILINNNSHYNIKSNKHIHTYIAITPTVEPRDQAALYQKHYYKPFKYSILKII